jgi:cobalamin biosynthesis protein CobD/CbiB
MDMLTTYLALAADRAQWLALLLLAGYAVGALFARGPLLAALRAGDAFLLSLGRKLDREHRSVPTLVYRGMIAVLILTIPTGCAGLLLSSATPWVQVLSALLIILWFGYCFQTTPTLALLKKAKNDGLGLQIPELDFLFADSHAVIRHLVTTRMDSFATGIVGAGFWYVAGGTMPMAIYLTLAAAAAAYRPCLAFGWAARGLFAVMDVVPRLIARVAILLAAIVTPHTKPFTGLFAPNWRGVVTQTLDISLSGPSADGQVAWAGTGTARLTHLHLHRTLHLLFAATLWLTLLLVSPIAYKLLIKLT